MKKPTRMSDEKRAAILDALGAALAATRKEAVDGRKESGIEEEWQNAQEFYDGYDDANRHEHVKVTTKPTEGGRSLVNEPHKPTGSTVFPNITQPYVDAAAARVGDMLLPTDDRNYVLEPTPVPELDALEELPQILPDAQASQPAAAAQPGMPAPPAVPAQTLAAMASGQQPPAAQPPQPKSPAAQAMERAIAELDRIRKEANAKAKLAQQQIDDWLSECQYYAEVRKCIDDSARIGSGVLKGPVPVTRKVRKWEFDQATGDYVLVIKKETKPASFRIDPWNFFPDPACGDNIQHGAYVWERDYLTPKRLQDLKGGVGPSAYLDFQITKVLEEGPQKRNASGQRNITNSKDLFEIWYFHGSVTAEQLEAAGCACESDDPQRLFPAKLTMVNDRVIKAALNPFDSGEFPYDVLPWKARENMPWGVGIGQQGRTPQRIVVAASRNLMDNAGASAKPHKIMGNGIEQGDDPWTWNITPDAPINDARAAMTFFEQPSRQAELMQIIEWGLQMMERVTGMPLILMGMQGNIEETAQGRTLQNNNGNSVLRRIARLFDSRLTEPHIRRYYGWLMEYGENPETKGDYQIVARGSAALVERDIQNQAMPNVIQMAKDPAFEISPKKARDELLKSWRFDPNAFDLTDEERAKLAQMQPPKAPQVQAAEIREQGATQREQLKQQGETQRTQMELETKTKISEGENSIARMVAEINGQLGAASLSAEERMALNDAKVSLSGIVMKLRAQREIAAVKGPQASKPDATSPAIEPPGRAPNGQAFAF